MTVPVQRRTTGTVLNNHDNRILALERNKPSGCCPGEWIVPELLNGWEHVDPTGCPFMYRWGPFETGDTVDDAGIEFSGQVQSGVSGTVLMQFPAEDRFVCDKDFIMLVFDPGPTGAWSFIDSATGDMTPTWPLA